MYERFMAWATNDEVRPELLLALMFTAVGAVVYATVQLYAGVA